MFYVILDGIPYDLVDVQAAVKAYKKDHKIRTEPALEIDEGKTGVGILDHGRTLISYIQHEKGMPTGVVSARINELDDIIPINTVLFDPNPKKMPGYHCAFFGESGLEDYNMMPNSSGRQEAEERHDFKRKRRSGDE